MFCSSAHKKISFRTLFFQMFFNKSLIKCEKFVSCLMQYSKKHWKWPGTYKLIMHSYWTPQSQNFAIPPIWLSLHSITQRYCYPCINFHTPQFQTFTSLLIGIFGVSNSTFFLLLTFLRNYVSIIVNIISNNTALQCYLLWIFVSIRRLLQLIVCIGVPTASHLPHLKNITPSFAKSPLKSANYPKPPF